MIAPGSIAGISQALDTRIGLTVVMTLISLPIVIWMLYTYFREIPSSRRHGWTAPALARKTFTC